MTLRTIIHTQCLLLFISTNLRAMNNLYELKPLGEIFNLTINQHVYTVTIHDWLQIFNREHKAYFFSAIHRILSQNVNPVPPINITLSAQLGLRGGAFVSTVDHYNIFNDMYPELYRVMNYYILFNLSMHPEVTASISVQKMNVIPASLLQRPPSLSTPSPQTTIHQEKSNEPELINPDSFLSLENYE